jgi:hypothetical protein
MGYVEANLLPDENIVYEARLHSIIFWKPCALIFVGVVCLIIQPIIATIVIAIGVFAMISPIIDYAGRSSASLTRELSSRSDFSGGAH